MNNTKPQNIPDELRFFRDCHNAISNQEYRMALETTKTGLEGMLSNSVSVDAQQLASLFYMTICHLESELKESYGEQWENRKIPKIPKKKKEIRCSFCGKEQREVQKIRSLSRTA